METISMFNEQFKTKSKEIEQLIKMFDLQVERYAPKKMKSKSKINMRTIKNTA